MKVSVVILNWNGKDMLRAYLPDVIAHTNMPDVEVVVADNGSTDGSVEMLERDFPDTPLVILEENYGFAEGYNMALRENNAEYFLLLNSDVEIMDDNWLKPMIEFMDNNPDVAACQPKIMSLKNKNLFEYAGAAGGFIDKYGFPFCRGRIFDVVETDKGQYDEVMDVFWASGAAMMVRAKDFWAVGGLDPRFFAHMEEIDLCWRLRDAGLRVVCLPQSKVYHLGGASLNQGNPRKTFLNFRNNLIMLYKNLPDNELNKVMKSRAWFDRLAALQFLLKFDKQNYRAVIKARKEFKKMVPDLQEDRARNAERRKAGQIKERVDFSIVSKFYIKGKRKFSQLHIPQ